MKVVFRVDASLQMGTGHVMRCLTLANELKQQNHEIVFICRELTGNLILLIKYPVLILPKNDDFQSDGLYLNWLGATQEKDAEQTIKAIPKNADLLIAADCTAFAHGDFHREFIKDRITIIFCPKLDQNIDSYIDKLVEIFNNKSINSITYLCIFFARQTNACRKPQLMIKCGIYR